VKQALLDYHGNTNYSVVDIDLIQELYRRTYREKVLGRERLRMLNLARATAVSETSEGLKLTVQSLVNCERTVLDADIVVFATGYHEADPFAVLGELGELCQRDAQGRPLVGRDYRVRTDSRLQAGIYLQGGTEHTHGISSALLSNTAVRVGEVLGSVLQHRDAALLVAA
jgi:L-ornithine N5-oxygenase